MLVIIHVLIALSSLLVVSWAFILPSVVKVRLSYLLVAATLLSGTYLVVVMPAHMLQACTTGLIYTGVVLVGIMATRVKLARQMSDQTI